MASQEQSTLGSSPTAQVIGNAFVQQYYLILHKSPELVHRFYQEQSKLGRPPPNGDMLSVTTLQTINEQILAMDLMKAEIKTVDSQDSLDGGVIVLVTGEITSHADVTREFTQTFFLAPQEKGYFVLNDLFRYSSGEGVKGKSEAVTELSNGGSVQETETQAQAQAQVTERSIPPAEEEDDLPVQEEVYNPSTNGDDLAVPAEEETPVPEVIDEPPPPVVVVSNNVAAASVVSSSVVVVEENAPKKSYASIVKVMKLNAAPISAPAPVARSAPPAPVASSASPAKLEKQAVPAPAVKPAENPTAFSSNTSDSSTPVQELDDGHSIYVRSLPINATPQQLEEEFAKFGTIRPGGIQVRSHKLLGFCYGFVEFEDAASVQNAIAASPVTLSDRQCFVEEKRASGSRGGNRGRYSGPRGGGPNNDRSSGSFRNEGPRSGRGGGGPRGGFGRDFNNNNNNNYRGGARGGPGARGPGPRSPAPVSTGAK